MSTCKCCGHPNREYAEKEVLSGRKSIAWGAEQLSVPYQTFWEHLQHVRVEKEEKFTGTMSEMLEEIIKELHKRFKKIVGLSRDDVSERDLKACVDSLNTCIINVAKLRRIIAPAPQIQIQQFNIQMTKLIEFLHTELPSQYQDKLAKFLESMR